MTEIREIKDPTARAMIEAHIKVCAEDRAELRQMFRDLWTAIDGLRHENDGAAKARERQRDRHLATLRWLAGILFTALVLLIGYIGRGWIA